MVDVHGEYMYHRPTADEMREKAAKELKEAKLNQTDAGLKAQELDAADGKKDGKISASVWNAYAREHGGKTIQNEISVEDAMNSIATYSVREQTEAAKAQKEAKANSGGTGNFGV